MNIFSLVYMMCFEIKDVTSLERQTNTPAIEIKAQEKVTKTREE